MTHKRLALAQNFFKSPDLVRSLVATSSIGQTDTVVEIGPGAGIITQALAAVAQKASACKRALMALSDRSFAAAVDSIPELSMVRELLATHVPSRVLDTLKSKADAKSRARAERVATCLTLESVPPLPESIHAGTVHALLRAMGHVPAKKSEAPKEAKAKEPEAKEPDSKEVKGPADLPLASPTPAPPTLKEMPALRSFANAGLAMKNSAQCGLVDRVQRLCDKKKFAKACELMMNCEGRVVVIGMGKSGHIGNKIAATLASTGTPAFFVHPGEACHGDMGMIVPKDIVLAISNSGETDELIMLLPMIKRLKTPMITLTGNPHSTLAKAATVNLDISAKEACPLGLAPTSSTATTLAMGDALAVALFQVRGLTKEDFARYHPGGKLGLRLLLKAEDVMYKDEQIPKILPDAKIAAALVEMTQKSLGMTAIVDRANNLLGIYTDGDVRRTLNRGLDVHSTPIRAVMTKNPKTISANTLAVEALQIMENYKITTLAVVDEQKKIIGIVHLHHLLQRGLSTLGEKI